MFSSFVNTVGLWEVGACVLFKLQTVFFSIKRKGEKRMLQLGLPANLAGVIATQVVFVFAFPVHVKIGHNYTYQQISWV